MLKCLSKALDNLSIWLLKFKQNNVFYDSCMCICQSQVCYLSKKYVMHTFVQEYLMKKWNCNVYNIDTESIEYSNWLYCEKK